MALSRQLRGLRRPLTDLEPWRPASLAPFASWTLHAPSALASHPASRASSVPHEHRHPVHGSRVSADLVRPAACAVPLTRMPRNSRPRITAALRAGSPLI